MEVYMAKKGPLLIYPIANRGKENGEAICATCWTTAARLLAKYQKRYGSNYYLMNGIPFAGNEKKFLIVMGDVPQPILPKKRSSSTALDRHARMMKQMHLDD